MSVQNKSLETMANQASIQHAIEPNMGATFRLSYKEGFKAGYSARDAEVEEQNAKLEAENKKMTHDRVELQKKAEFHLTHELSARKQNKALQARVTELESEIERLNVIESRYGALEQIIATYGQATRGDFKTVEVHTPIVSQLKSESVPAEIVAGLVGGLNKIKQQGVWSKNTTHKTALKLLDEYFELSEEALAPHEAWLKEKKNV